MLPLWALALPCSSSHPLPCSQEEGGGGVRNKLSLCSAFGQLTGTVGTGSHARENTGIQSCTWSDGRRFLGLWEELGSWHICCRQSSLLHSF